MGRSDARGSKSGGKARGASKHPVPVLRRGMLVDDFRVMRFIGAGGMGEVYLARDTKLGRKVALKVIRSRLLGASDTISQFMREAQTTAKFSHPNIVTVYAVGEHEGAPYIALEYLEGETLRERTNGKRLSLQESLRICAAAGEALVEAHRHGILHRDLKPSNVLIPRDGRVRVVDFGLAQAWESAVGGSNPPPDKLAPALVEARSDVTRPRFVQVRSRGSVNRLCPAQPAGESVGARSGRRGVVRTSGHGGRSSRAQRNHPTSPRADL